MSHFDYDQMADTAAAGGFTPTGQRLTGQAATDAARALLRDHGGTDDPTALAGRGRPSLSTAGTTTRTGPSPQIRTRIPAATKAALPELVVPLHQNSESDLIRHLITLGLQRIQEQTTDPQIRALTDQALGKN
ncbi:hypothetical protein JRG18_12320 [Kocuria palustris]|uniref:hypothetical protein n=1 Tax=Kocuria palustris TaxID=71999 RepID=UPI0019CF50EF|nr:hypothetical protein [Kocuria palustris]MBN6754284.1 hypothetical protein [Kocuria palustris]MBN6759238.1 hypothetical protein [Kocuria palustris]MBN6764278.1 hypothetical protein [Kocuria palustris]MBN6783763.1 hypothetical protein [Kocuria palustris]MBN6800245.1 hypothetical protein [Kocuria palustris]